LAAKQQLQTNAQSPKIVENIDEFCTFILRQKKIMRENCEDLIKVIHHLQTLTINMSQQVNYAIILDPILVFYSYNFA